MTYNFLIIGLYIHKHTHTQHTYHTSVKDNRKKILGKGGGGGGKFKNFLRAFSNF